MARARKLRRRVRRKALPVRRGGSDLVVGGARDPAEGAADRLAARALAGGVKSGRAVTSAAPALRRQAQATSLAPGSAASAAPKQAANLVRSLGTGRSLNAAERGYFEPRLGTDLSTVRVHEGRQADRASRALDAHAFAHGPDIAFARGKRSQETMAHELAHVVQDEPTRLRRVIATEVEDENVSDLRVKLKKDYGVENAFRVNNEYSLGSATKSGPMNLQIATAMLASPRAFSLKGKHLHRAEASLRDHLKARRGVVKYAKSIRVRFSTSADNFESGILKFIHDKAATLRKHALAEKKKKDPKFKPTSEDKKRLTDWSVLRAFQLHAHDKRLIKAIKIIRRRSEAYDKLNSSTKTKPFVAACFSATVTTMFAGSGGEVKRTDYKLPGSAPKEDRANVSDWVPGDWGHIKSRSIAPKKGQEGENIIYVGDNRFWAHFGSLTGTHSLKKLYDMVAKWDRAAPKPVIDTYRYFPKTGLK